MYVNNAFNKTKHILMRNYCHLIKCIVPTRLHFNWNVLIDGAKLNMRRQNVSNMTLSCDHVGYEITRGIIMNV